MSPRLMTTSSPATHVLFVCTGNTCRSPLAEAFFRKALNGRSDITVSSAGVSAYNGSPASAESAQIAEKNGTSLEDFCSSEVSPDLIAKSDTVFCLTKRHARTLLSAFPELDEADVYLIGEFVEIDGKTGRDIPDPFGMGQEAYQEVAAILEKATPNLIAFIDQKKS